MEEFIRNNQIKDKIIAKKSRQRHQKYKKTIIVKKPINEK